MNKHVISALLAVILAVAAIGCGGKNNGNDTAITTGTNKAPAQITDTDGTVTNEPADSDPIVTESGSATQGDGSSADVTTATPANTTTAATIGSGSNEPDEGGIIFTDRDTVIVVGTKGTTYINGQPATPDEVIDEINSSTTVVTKPVVTTPAVTTAPPATSGSTTVPDDIASLGKYNDTGDTKLNITKIAVFSNNDPGVAGLVNFDTGTLLLVNYWCDTKVASDGEVYFVSADVEHKGTYSSSEYAAKARMFQGFVAGTGQFFVEVQLPGNMAPGEYELRFCYGGEEEGFVRYIVE